jgi:molybdopterin converting factor small subunit
MHRVRIAPLLRSYTGGRAEDSVPGRTLADVLSGLEARYPGIRFRVVDEQDQIRPHIWIFVAGRLARDLGQALSAGDEVQIIGALSGG